MWAENLTDNEPERLCLQAATAIKLITERCISFLSADSRPAGEDCIEDCFRGLALWSANGNLLGATVMNSPAEFRAGCSGASAVLIGVAAEKGWKFLTSD